MSDENVEVVRKAFDAFERGDVEGILRLSDEDIVVLHPPDLPGVPARLEGHDGLRQALRVWPEEWDDYRTEILRIAAAPGDKVLTTQRTSGRGKQSGIEVDRDFSFVFTVRDGKVCEWRLFLEEDEALEAAGLSE